MRTNAKGSDRFRAFSAGSHPTGKVNPFALELLERSGFRTAGLRSKAWDEFAVPDAPRMDVVITVCDQAAGEACPVWPGRPFTAHWGVEDPAAVSGGDATKRAAFERVFLTLQRRIGLLMSLPMQALDQLTAGQRLRDIGKQQ